MALGQASRAARTLRSDSQVATDARAYRVGPSGSLEGSRDIPTGGEQSLEVQAGDPGRCLGRGGGRHTCRKRISDRITTCRKARIHKGRPIPCMVRPYTAYTLRPGGAEFTRRPGNAEANHRHWQLTAADIYDEVLQWPTGAARGCLHSARSAAEECARSGSGCYSEGLAMGQTTFPASCSGLMSTTAFAASSFAERVRAAEK